MKVTIVDLWSRHNKENSENVFLLCYFDTTPDFRISLSLQLKVVDLRYFKLLDEISLKYMRSTLSCNCGLENFINFLQKKYYNLEYS